MNFSTWLVARAVIYLLKRELHYANNRDRGPLEWWIRILEANVSITHEALSEKMPRELVQYDL